MKTIENILCLIDTAKERAPHNGTGVAYDHRRYVGGKKHDEKQEVYRVEYTKTDMAGDTVKLFHHGTKIAEVWIAAQGASLMDVYGQSRSDADAVNTFLKDFGINERYGTRGGKFQRISYV